MAHNISFICREKQSPLLLRTLLVLYNESIEKKQETMDLHTICP